LEACRRIKGLVDYISGKYINAVEIGIGHYPDIAFSLLRRGVRVFATDIKQIRYEGLEVVIDNIIDPDFSLYKGLELVYSIRPPVELVPYMRELADKISADLIIKPLSSEYIGGELVIYGNTNFFMWKNQ
jgi:uncharacterized UPF0146 family protein